MLISQVLGLGDPWLGGDMNYPGGGYKINLLKKELETLKDKEDLIVLFTDSYDVVLTGSAEEIVKAFKSNFDGARIVFGSEDFCWPKAELESKYPEVEGKGGKRFLNSGGFIGYANTLYELVTYKEIDNKGDDQLYYTEIFLKEKLRTALKMKLDYSAHIFQNLNGAIADVELRFRDDSEPFLRNIATETNPLVIHGNGPTKVIFNSLTNYIPQAWNKQEGCTSCWEDTIEDFEKKFNAVEKIPKVVIGLFIEQPTPFLSEYFERIEKLTYPKEKIHIFIHNVVEEHESEIDVFSDRTAKSYASITRLRPIENVKEWHARNKGLDKCVEVECDYYFSVDSEAHIDNPHTLKLLIEQNRAVIAPMLVRPYKAWSNFWGALTNEGKLISFFIPLLRVCALAFR